jgi:alginate O-acetyltransferase complex protein AlgI
MIFSSLTFLGFFAAMLALLAAIPSANMKKALLLIGSYYFYAYWDYRFTVLMLCATVANYVFGLRIERSDDEAVRRRWLVASVVVNLSVLGFFKYFNFFVSSANALLASLGTQFPLLDIVLPVGISFIVFEVMSYTIDIYRRTSASARTVWDLALLVAFFPHLIAGPILKPREFLPQLENPITITWKNLEAGIQIFMTGLIKKLLIADNLAPFVDTIYKSPGDFASVTVWLAVLAYAIQIYCDFSGYTDMAIGSARCMGFSIPQNFNMPYVARSITDFWRRWHISLSTWLREYLYISLGGNRHGELKQYRNLMLTMLLGGLWHGASWNFVVWGGLHGVGLAAHKVYAKVRPSSWVRIPLYRGASWLVTFAFVSLAWVFFRSTDFATAMAVMGKLTFWNSAGTYWLPAALWPILGVVCVAHHLGRDKQELIYVDLTSFGGLFALFVALLLVLGLMPTETSPFIYFQF